MDNDQFFNNVGTNTKKLKDLLKLSLLNHLTYKIHGSSSSWLKTEIDDLSDLHDSNMLDVLLEAMLADGHSPRRFQIEEHFDKLRSDQKEYAIKHPDRFLSWLESWLTIESNRHENKQQTV